MLNKKMKTSFVLAMSIILIFSSVALASAAEQNSDVIVTEEIIDSFLLKVSGVPPEKVESYPLKNNTGTEVHGLM